MSSKSDKDHKDDGTTRRDFLYLTAAAFGAVGAGSVAWPFIDQMNPAADTLALASTEVDLTPIEEGQAIATVEHCDRKDLEIGTNEGSSVIRDAFASPLPCRNQKKNWHSKLYRNQQHHHG